MFERLKNLFNALFNKGMAKLETPEVLAEQAQNELETSVKKIKEAVTNSLTTEKMLAGQIQKNMEELATWEKRATVAVGAGNDDVAKQCLVKKQEHNQINQSLTAQLEEQKKSTAALKERSAEMDEKLKEFYNKRKSMTARAQANDAVIKANDLLSNTGGGTGGMDKWEQKIKEKEYRSEAIRELSGNSKADDVFKELDKQGHLDDELAALKAKIGAGSPKLIVDNDKSKPQVDDNVPMVVEVIEPEEKK